MWCLDRCVGVCHCFFICVCVVDRLSLFFFSLQQTCEFLCIALQVGQGKIAIELEGETVDMEFTHLGAYVTERGAGDRCSQHVGSELCQPRRCVTGPAVVENHDGSMTRHLSDSSGTRLERVHVDHNQKRSHLSSSLRRGVGDLLAEQLTKGRLSMFTAIQIARCTWLVGEEQQRGIWQGMMQQRRGQSC
jgi:hypothetical protein